MSNPLLIKNFVADAAISAFTLVKLGSADANVAAAAAATDLLIGAIQDVAPALGERCDVVVAGIAYCTAGAAITRGTRLTSDASGRVIAAAPAAGSNVQLIGYALETASALGDVIRIFISPSVMQG